MDIKTSCPSCDKAYRVPAAAAGKSFACKQCGAKVRVPVQDDDEDLPIAEPILDDEPVARAVPSASRPAARAESDSDPLAFGSSADPVAHFPVGFNVSAGSRKRRGMDSKKLAMIGGGAAVLLVAVVAIVVFGGGEKPKPSTTPGPVAQNDKPKRPAIPDPRQRDQRTPIVPPVSPNDPDDDPQADPDPDIEIDDPGLVTPTPTKPNYDQDRKALAELRGKFPQPAVKIGVSADKHKPVAPLGAWSAGVDPPGTQFRLDPKLSININDRWLDDMQFPATTSPYFVVGDNDSDDSKRIIVDLRTGSPLWTCGGKVERNDQSALSPDGRRLALLSGKGMDQTIVMASRGSKKRFELGIGTEERIERRLYFAGPTLLLMVDRVDRKVARIMGIDAARGKSLWELKDLKGTSNIDTAVVLSPGGAYLAMPIESDANYLLVIDTATGETVGRAALPGGDGRCQYLAFSPDGGKLAGTFESDRYVGVWDMASGRSLYWSAVDPQLIRFGSKGSGFAMLDNDRLVTWGGLVIVDAATGQGSGQSQVKLETDFRSQQLMHLFSGASYLVMEKKGFGRSAANQITSGVLDLGVIQSGFDAMAAGGDEFEIGLPILEETFYSEPGKSGIPIDPGRVIAWPIAIQARVTPPGTARPVRVVIEPGESVYDKSRRSRPRDTATYRLTQTDGNGNALLHHPDGRVFRISVTSPTAPRQLDLPGEMFPLWLAEDGTAALFRTGAYRLSLVAIPSGEVLDQWRIRNKPAEDDIQRGFNNTSDTIASAALINGNRLWVTDEAGTVTLIDTENKQVLLTGVRSNIGAMPIDAEQKYMLCINTGSPGTGQLRIVETATGIAVGAYDAGGPVIAYDLSPDGSKLAMSVNAGMQRELVVFDVAQNSELSRSVISSTEFKGSGLTWVNNHQVMIIGQFTHLIQADTGRVLWRYQIKATFLGRRDGQTAWVVFDAQRQPVLTSFALPHAHLASALTNNPELAMQPPPVLGPGAGVRVEIGGVENSEAMIKDLAEQFEAGGLSYNDNARFTLRVNRSVESSSKDIELTNGESRSMTEYKEVITSQWIDRNGDVLWTRNNNRSFGVGGGLSVFVRDRQEGETVLQAKQREIDESLRRGAATSITVPVFLPVSIEKQVLGESVLTEAGFAPPVTGPAQ